MLVIVVRGCLFLGIMCVGLGSIGVGVGDFRFGIFRVLIFFFGFGWLVGVRRVGRWSFGLKVGIGGFFY